MFVISYFTGGWVGRSAGQEDQERGPGLGTTGTWGEGTGAGTTGTRGGRGPGLGPGPGVRGSAGTGTWVGGPGLGTGTWGEGTGAGTGTAVHNAPLHCSGKHEYGPRDVIRTQRWTVYEATIPRSLLYTGWSPRGNTDHCGSRPHRVKVRA